MSLKAFHLFFIIVSTLFFSSFCVWCIYDYTQRHQALSLAMAAGSAVGGAVMIPYSRWFLHKLKDVGYL